MSTLVDVAVVTNALVATLNATIRNDGILVGDHQRPFLADGDDAADFANRPKLEVYRVPIGGQRQVGPDSGGFVGQDDAMKWVRHELRATEGITRDHVDAVVDQATAVILERDTDRTWMYDITATGHTVMDRRSAGSGVVVPPFDSDWFSVSGFVDLWVHASG